MTSTACREKVPLPGQRDETWSCRGGGSEVVLERRNEPGRPLYPRIGLVETKMIDCCYPFCGEQSPSLMLEGPLLA